MGLFGKLGSGGGGEAEEVHGHATCRNNLLESPFLLILSLTLPQMTFIGV